MFFFSISQLLPSFQPSFENTTEFEGISSILSEETRRSDFVSSSVKHDECGNSVFFCPSSATIRFSARRCDARMVPSVTQSSTFTVCSTLTDFWANSVTRSTSDWKKKGTRVFPPTGTMMSMASDRERNSYMTEKARENGEKSIDLLSEASGGFSTRICEIVKGQFDIVFIVEEVGDVDRHLANTLQTQLALCLLDRLCEADELLRMLAERERMILREELQQVHVDLAAGNAGERVKRVKVDGILWWTWGRNRTLLKWTTKRVVWLAPESKKRTRRGAAS